MYSRRQFTLALAAILASPGISRAAEAVFRLGTLPVITTRTAFRLYQPMLEHLEKTLNRPLSLETPPNFRVLYQRIRENAFDLVVSPPHIARLAQVRLGWHPLVSCQPEHHSLLLTLAESGLERPEALRGGTLAILDRSALVVMIMLDALARRGLVAERDFKLIETRSYESSLLAVKQGVAQAMVARSQGFLSPTDRERARLLLEAGRLPGYVFLAAPATPEGLRQFLREQLLLFSRQPEAAPFLAKLGYASLAAADETTLQRLDIYLDATEQKLR